MAFVQVRAKKKSDYIAEQILQAIQNGIYRSGDKLPAEEEIAQQTGTSRTSVREALSALRLTGIVESVTGNGTYVRRTEAHEPDAVLQKLVNGRPGRRSRTG